MKRPTIFRLKVDKVQQSCLFELSWGQGQQLKATLDYSQSLTSSFQAWQRAYLHFYRTAMRGRVEDTGSLTPLDPRTWLVQAEAKLLVAFRNWLWHEKLRPIHQAIAEVAQTLNQPGLAQSKKSDRSLHIFLTCHPLELERLPWEAWEIERQIASPIPIRLARTPPNIHSPSRPKRSHYRRGGARILAIFGDSTGLDWQGDLKALDSLRAIGEIEVIAWQEGQEISQLKRRIARAIADQRGWDLLFFAGHSRETDITGGELGIAPNTAISIREIAPQLQQALARGLQFALFNSCSGLSIANALIDLGFSQVAIMREPVHNQVAQVFLVKFLQVLADYQDVGDALGETCQFLQQEGNLDYPSAYLIPSLFCHPEASLFQIQPFGLTEQLKQWLPTRCEGIALSILVLLSLLSPVQDFLLNARTLAQAIYRDFTAQVPPPATPPVLLLEIDEESLQKAGIGDPNPLNRQYLARLIDKLTVVDAKGIGIDYLLDRPQGDNDAILSQSLQRAVNQQGIWFVFAAVEQGDREVGVLPSIADLNWSLQGSIVGLPQYVRLPVANCQRCPFAYLLAVVGALNGEQLFSPSASSASLASSQYWPQPQLTNQEDLRIQLFTFLEEREIDNSSLGRLKQAKISGIARLSRPFYQLWGRPINDFSLPPDTIYQPLPAWKLLAQSPQTLAEAGYRFHQQVILIASGGYVEAGIGQEQDYFPVPLAVAYWRERLGIRLDQSVLTGGEAHAYTIHHWLTGRLVIPIPDHWLVLLAAFLGKGITLWLVQPVGQPRRWIMGLVSATAAYGLVSLQVYLTAGILLPWLLPSAALGIYSSKFYRKI